jgi:flavorubredoxin
MGRNYQENQITLIYDTMYNGTRIIAENNAIGIMQGDKSIAVKLYNAGKMDKNDILTEVFRSKAILMGSPTVNNGAMYATTGLLEMIKGLKFVNKKAAALVHMVGTTRPPNILTSRCVKQALTSCLNLFQTTGSLVTICWRNA